MKLHQFIFILGCLGVAEVLAAPTRLLIIGTPKETTHGVVRVGLVAPAANSEAWSNITPGKPQRLNSRPGCANKFRNKAVALSNKFRITFGLPPIDPSAGFVHPRPDHHHHHHLPHVEHVTVSLTNGEQSSNPQPAPHHGHHGHHGFMHHGHGFHHHTHPRQGWHHSSFLNRLTFALMALGKWEGRAVAFVLGCGLGVLLRMVWVFSVLLIRAGRRSEPEESEYESVEYFVLEEEAEEQPPTYVSAEEEKKGLEAAA